MNTIEDNTWNVIPGAGLGLLEFGMTPAQVAVLIGAPKKTRPIWNGSGFKEFRDLELPIIGYGTDGKLKDIEAGSRVIGVYFHDLNIFTEEPEKVVRVLHEANGKAVHYGLGTFAFWNLGITFGGIFNQETERFYTLKDYSEGEQDDRSLAVWPKNDQRWNNLKSEFTEFNL